jgi:CheY-like chemotaxis protein
MTDSPKHVLVADNDPDTLSAVAINLKMAGYTVSTAADPEKAQQVLRDQIIHLAIIDMRLRADKQMEASGFDVARKVPEYIPFVIYTAFEDSDTIKQALTKVGAKESLDKKKPGAAALLIETVDKLFESSVKVNFGLRIEGELDCNAIANEIELPLDVLPHATNEDVCQILQSLFNEAQRVFVAPLFRPDKSAALSQSGSIILRVRPQYASGWGESRVVKFSFKAEIQREQENYQRIRRFLGGNRIPSLEGMAFSRQLGGLVYSLIDASDWEAIMQFSEFFRANDGRIVSEFLGRFFTQTFASIFADATRSSINLTEDYTNVLNLTPQKLRDAVQAFHPESLSEPSISFERLPGSYVNPILWVLSGNELKEFDVLSRSCLCHGDLHGRNILVDSKGNFWLIDFARVANGHVLRDFIELETDIKFNIMYETDLKQVLPFEKALLFPNKVKEPVPDLFFTNDGLTHAYHIIHSLRKTAGDLISLDGDMREYYEALLLNTLNVLRLKHISSAKKEYALLSASLICERLSHWPERGSIADLVQDMISYHPAMRRPEVAPQATKRKVDSFWQGWVNLLGASVFFVIASVAMALLWWVMHIFGITWQQQLGTYLFFSVSAIIAFALLGLIKGPEAINAILKIFSLFNRQDEVEKPKKGITLKEKDDNDLS